MDLADASGNPLNSVTTILMKNKNASSDPTVLTIIQNSEAIFFAGGDQSEYVNEWEGTDMQTTIQAKLVNITVGGTSAGCMILGNYIYSAETGSVTSDEALDNPYNKYMTFAPAFLTIPYLSTVIADTHFG